MLMVSSRDCPGKSTVHMLHIIDLNPNIMSLFTQLCLLLFNSLKNQTLRFKGCVCYIFASLFYMFKKEHLRKLISFLR